MNILRVYIRTFENEQHAEMFMSVVNDQISKILREENLAATMKLYQNPNNKEEIISIWEYENAQTMKSVQKKVADVAEFPKSLNPITKQNTGILRYIVTQNN